MAVAHNLAGRYDESIKWARQAVQLRSGFVGAYRTLCAALAQAGQIDEAQAVLGHIRQMQPHLSIAWIKQSIPYTPKPMAHFLDGMRKAGLTD